MTARRNLVFSIPTCVTPEIGVWMAALEDGRERTKKVIAGLRRDELEWVDPRFPNTIGTLLYHIAAIELDWLYAEILVREFPDDAGDWFPLDVRDGTGRLSPMRGEELERPEARLAYVREKLLGVLATMPESEFRRPRTLEAYDVQPQWVVHHLLQHEAEHRAQISMLREAYRSLRGSEGG
jgi:uncharacterized damage-inducible protein DinB